MASRVVAFPVDKSVENSGALLDGCSLSTVEDSTKTALPLSWTEYLQTLTRKSMHQQTLAFVEHMLTCICTVYIYMHIGF